MGYGMMLCSFKCRAEFLTVLWVLQDHGRTYPFGSQLYLFL